MKIENCYFDKNFRNYNPIKSKVMPSIVVRLQFASETNLGQRMINEIKSSVLNINRLDLKERRKSVSVDIIFTQRDSDFPNGHFIAEITLDKRPERTKEVLDLLACTVFGAIAKTLVCFDYNNFFGEVWTKTLDESCEGFCST